MNIKIRDATSQDIDALVSGTARMAVETEGRTLDEATLRKGVGAVLVDPDKGRYWVAEIEGRVVGQLMITWEWSDWRNGAMWWIQSVYVDPEHRRAGVFSALYRHIEKLARSDDDCCGIRLYVERDNSRAQDTYRKLGMAVAGYLVMESDFGNRVRD